MLAEKEHDFVTRSILTKLLDDTEVDHAHWLEQQLKLIKAMGINNYLQSQAS
ncbi:Bacterioferritin [compost metagenome]